MVRWTRAVAVFTFFLVVTAGVSDWFIFQQGADTQRAQSYVEEQLRATVALLGIFPVPAVDPAGKPEYGFMVQYQNQGGTRALGFQYWGSIHYFPDKVPNNFDPTKPYDEVSPKKTTLGPNGISPLVVGLPKTDGDQAIAGNGKVLIWGRGTFESIYKPDTQIPFAFCYVMLPLKIPKMDSSGGNKTTAQAAPVTNALIPQIGGDVTWQAQEYRPDCNYSE